MILVDSGVLIDFLRTKDPKLGALFRARPVAVCGVVRTEILRGARGSSDRQKLILFLRPFLHVATPETVWDLAGDNLASLRTVGLTIPMSDALIATLGIANDLEVWARDPHFPMIQTVLPALRLFAEPP
jgi:predicted nucleic acid-binding protein